MLSVELAAGAEFQRTGHAMSWRRLADPVIPLTEIWCRFTVKLLVYPTKDANFFVKTFDDRDTQIKFDNYNEDNKADRDQDMETDSLIYDLLEQEETIPIEAHYDFMEALKKAYIKFRNGKIAEHLSLAHEQYLFNKQMGFEIERDRPTDTSIRETYLKQILDGREANGEPRDLNF